MASIHSLISIFDEVNRLLLRSDNDFSYSSWKDSAEACAEITQVREKLRSGEDCDESQMTFLFLPTGPLQELSLSSGLGDEYVDLANRFDEAIRAEECSCYQSSQQGEVHYVVVGFSQEFAEITLGMCSVCCQVWLRYQFENEGYKGSGRWFLGAISDSNADNLRVSQAKAILEGLDWYWVGGSYFGGNIGVRSGPIVH